MHSIQSSLNLCTGRPPTECDDIRDCIIQFCPPDDEHMCSKHVEAWNKLIIKFSASSWLILINKYIEMYGQQNIKKLVQNISWLRFVPISFNPHRRKTFLLRSILTLFSIFLLLFWVRVFAEVCVYFNIPHFTVASCIQLTSSFLRNALNT